MALASMDLVAQRKSLLEAALHLPAAPQVLAEINELLLDPHLQLWDVVRVLRRDAALAAAILRVANSALYAGAERVGSLEDAVSRLGLAEVYRVTGLALTSQFSNLALAAYGLRPGQVAQSALLHAVALEALCSLVGEDPLIGYTTALVRPLGPMVVDHLLRAEGRTVEVPASAGRLAAAEEAWVGLASPEISALVLEEWRFPSHVVAAVREQRLPGGVTSASRLAVALNVAGGLAADLGGAVPCEAGFWMRDAAKLSRLGLTEADLALVRDRAEREYARQSKALV